MPSKYRPQIFGWFGDLDKGPRLVPLHDDRLSYANNNYCAFIRQIPSDLIFYTCLYFVAIILGSILIVGSCTFIMDYDHPDSGSMLCFNDNYSWIYCKLFRHVCSNS
ncbi:hypothetical protein [Gilliamella sp. App4-10]|uniref:hypothetical protein n=1 Tax=Gilliamella sp. App4-10 TaxID=3120231 RepID=UPI00080E758B|nr:hypothetical protein [Gilliamella apicola]OCG19509.1 hypothetical protein A9G23_09170 [Gilliamella apicola]